MPKTLFGMEPSGNYWVHLYEHLEALGKRIVTVSSLAVNRNRETINVSKDKSDPKGAYNIADLMKQGKFYFPIYRDKEIRELKRFMQIYYRLIAQKASLICILAYCPIFWIHYRGKPWEQKAFLSVSHPS